MLLKKQQMSILVIIGLPASGKSSYIKQNNYENYNIYDDFIPKFNNGNILQDIKNKKNICLIDPRLCNITIFNKYISSIEKYVDKKNISLILFENNKDKCLENLKKYRKELYSNYESTINFYSHIYDIKNYNNYNSIVIKVYEEN